ncbi:hypothetical protein IMY05_001G0200500 [Salix suchowensis]|nr:hypothetical protein IMY05_001G0200500 [Salix suchowensis]
MAYWSLTVSEFHSKSRNRLAARFGAKIVLFGVVGEDDCGEVRSTNICNMILLHYTHCNPDCQISSENSTVEPLDMIQTVVASSNFYINNHTSSSCLDALAE